MSKLKTLSSATGDLDAHTLKRLGLTVDNLQTLEPIIKLWGDNGFRLRGSLKYSPEVIKKLKDFETALSRVLRTGEAFFKEVGLQIPEVLMATKWTPSGDVREEGSGGFFMDLLAKREALDAQPYHVIAYTPVWEGDYAEYFAKGVLHPTLCGIKRPEEFGYSDSIMDLMEHGFDGDEEMCPKCLGQVREFYPNLPLKITLSGYGL